MRWSWATCWCGLTPRERALEVFGLLRVWDTEHNTGVLIYVLHAEHAVEIVADRGIARRVPQAEWDALCREVETDFGPALWRRRRWQPSTGPRACWNGIFPATRAGATSCRISRCCCRGCA